MLHPCIKKNLVGPDDTVKLIVSKEKIIDIKLIDIKKFREKDDCNKAKTIQRLSFEAYVDK